MALNPKVSLALAGAMSLVCCSPVIAGLSDYLDTLKGAMDTDKTAAPATAASLSDAEVVSGLKAALEEGTRYAVDTLGKEGGYLDNASVRIPMPDNLVWVEKSLRSLGQDQLADEFVASMNHAAEQAVPEAAAIFTDTIQAMSMDDARAILNGSDDAATQYFRKHTESTLTERMLPIVTRTTENTGVTSAYKRMLASTGGMTGLLAGDATDIDAYVTRQALDGLFSMVAVEEKRIRENHQVPFTYDEDVVELIQSRCAEVMMNQWCAMQAGPDGYAEIAVENVADIGSGYAVHGACQYWQMIRVVIDCVKVNPVYFLQPFVELS